MQTNEQILAERLAEFNAIPGPRVGDFLALPFIHKRLGDYTRLTHDWGDTVQTGGMNGSYYLGGCLSYSGGLDRGIKRSDIGEQLGTRDGSLWFFDQGISGAGRGVNFKAPMRVFSIRSGADLSGIGELQCPFYLSVFDEKYHEQTCNYWYGISHHGTNHWACTTELELRAWLEREGLKLTMPLTPPGVHSSQSLAYA